MAKELMGNVLYNESLLTPGYQVEAAIGTSYSLDLETLLEVPLALGELTGNAEQYIQRPYYLLDVINVHRCQGRVLYVLGYHADASGNIS